MAKRSEAAVQENKDFKYWNGQIEQAKKRFDSFWSQGDKATTEYYKQKEDGSAANAKDTYAMLYSSTETIRPNLYAQAPKPMVRLRNTELAPPAARDGAMLLEGCLEYVVDEGNFNFAMDCVVEDFLLPGLGQVWLRYEPTFKDIMDSQTGKPRLAPDGTPEQELIDEVVCVDYVFWKDFLVGPCRQWDTRPWVARRLWMNKERAAARFGQLKAHKLKYTTRDTKASKNDGDIEDETAEIWEIWDIRTKKAYWLAPCYDEGLLDEKTDPLRLKNFFPCPRPLRAVYTNRSFVPKPLYEMYRTQAETINTLTMRIRLLTEALRVTGLYDGSFAALQNLLNPQGGNRMVAVDSFAAFAERGGLKGAVDWLPIEQVAVVLMEMFKAREIAKNEIYEITGFSDIVRGVSKASETLGAQNIKANWAGARVKKMQSEVQRFARDAIAIVGEIISEHCGPETIVLFAGLHIPTAAEMQSNPKAPEQMQKYLAAIEFIKSDAQRLAAINIETDSTIQADQEAERADRMQFLSSAGAFLQQAVPAIQTAPALGPLLASMLMFSVRTFPSSRPIEDEFQRLQEQLLQNPQGLAQPQQGDDGKAKAESAQAVAGIKAQTDKERIASEERVAMADADRTLQLKQDELALKREEENNRHFERMRELDFKEAELDLREREVAVKEAELGIKQQDADTREASAAAAAADNQAEATALQAQALEDKAEDQARTADREDAREAREASEGSDTEGGPEGSDDGLTGGGD